MNAPPAIRARDPSPQRSTRGTRAEDRARYTGPTYYDLPPLKASFWGELVAAYLFVGGLAGASQVVATLADLTGASPRVTRNGRLLAAGGAAMGAALLVADLRTPNRWYNMLRIWRRTSPMSIGTWVLNSFAAASALPAAAAVFDSGNSPLAHRLGSAARISQLPAAAAGAAMCAYTAPLLSATSTPWWAASPRLLAVRFCGAATASAAAALALGQHAADDPRSVVALDRLTAFAASVELGAAVAGDARARRLGIEAPALEPRLRALRWAALAVGCGLPIACHALAELRPRRSRTLSLVAAAATLAGGYLMRSAVLRSGNATARRAGDAFALAQPTHLPGPRRSATPTVGRPGWAVNVHEAVAARCREAREAIGRALDGRPDDPERSLAECSQKLAAARDLLIRQRREDAASRGVEPPARGTDADSLRLRHVNEAISLVASCELPIQGTRWSRIEGARDALQRLAVALGG